MKKIRAVRVPVLPETLLDTLVAIRNAHVHGCGIHCDGPDSPPVPMATGSACWAGWRLRCILIAHDFPIIACSRCGAPWWGEIEQSAPKEAQPCARCGHQHWYARGNSVSVKS